jgi:hypothetical protein
MKTAKQVEANAEVAGKSKSQKKRTEPAHELPVPPITVYVAYDWGHDRAKPKQFQGWPFIRDRFTSTLKSLASKQGNERFAFRVQRMRGFQGGMLLEAILTRCKRGDMIAFDISTLNPNVLLELGIALGEKGLASGEVFVFMERVLKEENGKKTWTPVEKVPSDLEGYLLANYELGEKGLSLPDRRGVEAAIRFKALQIAAERGMLKSRKGDVSIEEAEAV